MKVLIIQPYCDNIEEITANVEEAKEGLKEYLGKKRLSCKTFMPSKDASVNDVCKVFDELWDENTLIFITGKFADDAFCLGVASLCKVYNLKASMDMKKAWDQFVDGLNERVEEEME